MAGVQVGMGAVMAVAVLLVLVIFAGLSRHLSDMVLGPGDAPLPDGVDRTAYGPRLPLALALGTTGVIGFAAGPFASLLTQAAAALGASG